MLFRDYTWGHFTHFSQYYNTSEIPAWLSILPSKSVYKIRIISLRWTYEKRGPSYLTHIYSFIGLCLNFWPRKGLCRSESRSDRLDELFWTIERTFLRVSVSKCEFSLRSASISLTCSVEPEFVNTPKQSISAWTTCLSRWLPVPLTTTKELQG